MIGKSFKNYTIARRLGEGGMGEVYLAEDTDLKRWVALKFLPESAAGDEDSLARFKREARAAAALNHPNIVTIHEIGSHEGRPYIAMSYIDGTTVRDDMTQGIPRDRALDIIVQACDGLEKAHKAGIIHRDIKPENLISDADGRVKILDFGIATFNVPGTSGSDSSTAGTVHYMSPEQTRGDQMDARSDIFSLGAILYEMLTGRRPFKGDHTSAVYYSILNEDPEPPSQINTAIDPKLEGVMTRTLAKDPENRFQSAADLATELRALRSGVSTGTGSSLFRRLAIPSLIVAAALVLFFIIHPFKDKSGVEGGAPAENALAIMYFDNMAQSGDPDRLGEIITELLITNLSQSEDLEVLSSQRLYDILKLQGREGAKVIDRSTATEIAKAAKAHWMMLGSILQVTPNLVVTTQLVDVATGTIEGSQRLTGAPGETVFTLVDRMTGQTRDELDVSVPLDVEAPKPVTDVTTSSLDAYRHYVEGLDNTYKLYYADAVEDFRRAIEIDSMFAMAYFRYAVASTKTNNLAGALAAIQHAGRFIDRVSDKERLYIEAMRAAFAFHQEGARAKLIEITKRYPEEKEAFFMLANMYYTNEDNEKAIEAYHNVLSLDPLHKPTYNQLAYTYDRVGDFEKSIWAINQYIELSPGEANPYDTQGDLYAYNGDIDNAIDSYRKALEIKPDFIQSREKLGDMLVFKGRYEEAAAQYKELTASDQPGVRSEGRLCLANIDIYRGRLRDGLKVLETGLAADEMEGFRGDAYLNKLGVRLGTYVELGQCERAAAGAGDVSTLLKKTFPMLAMIYDLVAAAFAAECGHLEVADSIFARVEPQVGTLDRNTLTAYHKTKGFVVLKGGDPGNAVRHLEIADSLGPNQFSTRYYLAKAYLETGRAEDAVSLLETALNRYDPSRLDDPLTAGKAVYLLGTAYEKVGATDKAVEQYRTILDRWKNADPEVEEVSEARERLERLGVGR